MENHLIRTSRSKALVSLTLVLAVMLAFESGPVSAHPTRSRCVCYRRKGTDLPR